MFYSKKGGFHGFEAELVALFINDFKDDYLNLSLYYTFRRGQGGI